MSRCMDHTELKACNLKLLSVSDRNRIRVFLYFISSSNDVSDKSSYFLYHLPDSAHHTVYFLRICRKARAHSSGLLSVFPFHPVNRHDSVSDLICDQDQFRILPNQFFCKIIYRFSFLIYPSALCSSSQTPNPALDTIVRCVGDCIF